MEFPIVDEAGHRFVGGIALEITGHKRAEQALLLEHQMNESMIATARNIVLVLDSEGRITRFNPWQHPMQRTADHAVPR